MVLLLDFGCTVLGACVAFAASTDLPVWEAVISAHTGSPAFDTQLGDGSPAFDTQLGDGSPAFDTQLGDNHYLFLCSRVRAS